MMKRLKIPFIIGFVGLVALTTPAQAGILDNLFGDTLRIDMHYTSVDGREYRDHGYCDFGALKDAKEAKQPKFCLLDFTFDGKAPFYPALGGRSGFTTLQVVVAATKNANDEYIFATPGFIMDEAGDRVRDPDFALHESFVIALRDDFEENGAELPFLHNEPLAAGITGFVRDRTRIGTLRFTARPDDR